MRFRFALIMALVALAACEATTQPRAPDAESTDFILLATGGTGFRTSSQGDLHALGMGEVDTLMVYLPEGLLTSDAEPVWEMAEAPFQSTVVMDTLGRGDTLLVTFTRPLPESGDGGSTGTTGGGGGAIGSYGNDDASEGPLMAPPHTLGTIVVHLGALRGVGRIQGVVILNTVAIRPYEYGDATGICLQPGAGVDVMADGRSIPMDDLPGGSYQVPATAEWAVEDSDVAVILGTREEGGVGFATIRARAAGETTLNVRVRADFGRRTDDIPVRVSTLCPR